MRCLMRAGVIKLGGKSGVGVGRLSFVLFLLVGRCWRIDVIALVRVCARSKAVAVVRPDCWSNFGSPGRTDVTTSCGCEHIVSTLGLWGAMGAIRRLMFGGW